MSQGWQIIHKEKFLWARTERLQHGDLQAPSLAALRDLPGGLLESLGAVGPSTPPPLPLPAQLGQVRAVWLVLSQLSHL